jgi:hypothetical protein
MLPAAGAVGFDGLVGLGNCMYIFIYVHKHIFFWGWGWVEVFWQGYLRYSKIQIFPKPPLFTP